MELQHVLQAHPGNCICIEFDPTGKVIFSISIVISIMIEFFSFQLCRILLEISSMLYFKFQYFAVGSADALVSLWDVNELACLRTLSRLDWPIRSVSFSYDGKLLASASEDLFIDIGHVETGKQEKYQTGQIAQLKYIPLIYRYIQLHWT